jgi:hypothetical protein
MANEHRANSRPRVLQDLASAGSRAAAATLRPFTGAAQAAAGAGLNLERRAVDRLLDSGELERLLDSPRLRAMVKQVIESDGAKQLIDTFFDSHLFDRFVDRLLASDALWHLVDEVAASPAVTAAISQQGLGFADQVGDQVRARSRKADDWLERFAHRVIHRRDQASEAPETSA